MKWMYLCYFIFGSLPLLQAEEIVVYVFMGEECVISQNYTKTLRELHATYSSDSTQFLGVFPNQYSSNNKLQQFKEKYKLPFELILDKAQYLMSKFEVSITPEVVVYSVNKEKVLYKGRIDNTYYKIGRRRQVTTTAELENALRAIMKGEAVPIKTTQAVGCIITPVDPNFKNLPLCNPENYKN